MEDDHFTKKVKYARIATVMLLLFLFWQLEDNKRPTISNNDGDEERDLSKCSADVPSVSVDRRLLTKCVSDDTVQSDNQTVLIYLCQHPYIIRYEQCTGVFLCCVFVAEITEVFLCAE